MSAHDADLIVVGSGHNGLVCAAYAARAGYQVLVLERREDVGGAVCTRDMFGGYKIDVGGSLHCLIHATPIYTDLALNRYGLEYIELDPILSVPCLDGNQFYLYRDLEQSCQSIATLCEEDAERYYRYVKKWQPLNNAVFELFLQRPTLSNIFKKIVLPAHGFRMKERMLVIKDILKSYGDTITETLTDPRIRAAMTWWAAQSGPPPTAPASAELFAWQSMLHTIGAFRPKGGSGMLSVALRRYIEAHGGTVLTEHAVEKIIVKNNRACGVQVASNRSLSARAIVANAHVQIVFNTLLQEWTPPSLRAIINTLSIGNGFGMVVRCATDTLPVYRTSPQENSRITKGIQLLCPSVEYLTDAYADYMRGIPSQNPAALAMTFSAIDPTLAPTGKHILFVWGQYYPYRLRAHASWKRIETQEAEKLLGVVEQFAPGTREQISNYYCQSPERIAELHAMPHANVMHIDMSIDNMFCFRPHPLLSRYKTPLPGLFLASAGMHPGGGIYGAAGYNCSAVVLRYLSKSNLRTRCQN